MITCQMAQSCGHRYNTISKGCLSPSQGRQIENRPAIIVPHGHASIEFVSETLNEKGKRKARPPRTAIYPCYSKITNPTHAPREAFYFLLTLRSMKLVEQQISQHTRLLYVYRERVVSSCRSVMYYT